MRRTADNPDGNSSAHRQSETAAPRLLLDRSEPANLLGKAAVECIGRVMARVTTTQGSIRMAAQPSVMSQFYHK
jgi:hypothetical protein